MASATQSDSLPVFYAEGPALVDVLSRALDLPTTGKWRNHYLSEERLAELLRTRQVELVILTDAHHLSNRPHAVEWLVSYFRQHLNHAPLVQVGASQQMDELLLWKATAWVVRRFHRIQLSGELEEQEHVAPDS